MIVQCASDTMSRARAERPDTSAESDSQTDIKWYVLHTRARQEKKLAETLCAMGVEFFLPLISQAKYYGRRKSRVELPLFANYLFMRGELDQVYEADRTKRVANIIDVPDQRRLENELNHIRVSLENDAPLQVFQYLREGIDVEVTSGPFRGVQGVIENWTKGDRLVLQIDALGRAASLEIDASLLKPV